MNAQNVRKRCRDFNNGRTSVTDEQRSEPSSTISVDFVTDSSNIEDRWFNLTHSEGILPKFS